MKASMRVAWVWCLLVVLVVPITAYAQTQAKYSFDLPSQALSDSLRAAAKKAHVNIMFDPGDVNGKRAPGIKGQYGLKQALKRLLAGTDLAARFTSAATVVVAKQVVHPSMASPASPATTRSSEKPKPVGLSAVVVTGTHIVGVESAPTLPKITITHEQIAQRGYTSLSDLLRSVSMNFSNMGNSNYFNPNSEVLGGSSIGSTAVNLRGLGTGATLVLIDGHRTANAPTKNGTMVDISKIPIAMVQRVEIITGPAAAIYGSDAVAGVVNIITRKDYTGAQTYVGYANSSTDADLRELRQLVGFGWGSGNLTFSASYKKRDGASLAALGITTLDQRPRGGRDFRDFTYSTPAQLHSGYSASGFITIPGAPPGTSSALLPGGNGKNVHDLVYISNKERALGIGNYLLIHPSNSLLAGYLTPDTKNISGHINLTQRFNSAINLSLGITYSNRHSMTEGTGYPGQAIVPASNAYNHFGQPVLVDFNWDAVFGHPVLTPSTDSSINVGANATLSFEFPWRDWTGKLGLSDSRSTQSAEETVMLSNYAGYSPDQPLQKYDALVAALKSSDPAHALNLFSSNVAQPGGFTSSNFSYQKGVGDTISKNWSANGNVTGTIFSLPTGRVKLAVGLAVRRDRLNFEQFGPVFSTPPSRLLHGYYGELFVPLMSKDASGRRPLILQIADRYDRYSIRGPFGSGTVAGVAGTTGYLETKYFGASSPDIGLRWQPSGEWTIKANWGKAYQTPTLQDLFKVRRSVPYAAYDPYNPASNGGPKTVLVPLEVGGNPDLKPQTSKTTTLAVTYKPAALPGLIATIDYSDIRITNLVAPGVSQGFIQAIANPALNPGVIRDANGVLVALNLTPINAAIQRSKAFDIRAFYNFYTNIGYFVAGVTGTYTKELSEKITAQAPIVYSQGRVIGPSKWHVIPSLVWHNRQWSANVFWNYYSGVLNTDLYSPQRRIASISTVDLQVGWHASGGRLKVLLGAHNVFNKNPPFYDSRYGIDLSRYNAVGRQIYLHFIVSFGGGVQ